LNEKIGSLFCDEKRRPKPTSQKVRKEGGTARLTTPMEKKKGTSLVRLQEIFSGQKRETRVDSGEHDQRKTKNQMKKKKNLIKKQIDKTKANARGGEVKSYKD